MVTLRESKLVSGLLKEGSWGAPDGLRCITVSYVGNVDPPTVIEHATKLVEDSYLNVVAQDVFVSNGACQASLDAFGELSGKVSWPVVWMRDGAAGDFISMHTYVTDKRLRPITIGTRYVG